MQLVYGLAQADGPCYAVRSEEGRQRWLALLSFAACNPDSWACPTYLLQAQPSIGLRLRFPPVLILTGIVSSSLILHLYTLSLGLIRFSPS